MLKAKDGDFFISDWLRNRNTLEYLGIWERLYNPDFNYGEQASRIYAGEADVLNVAMFGVTALEWRDAHPDTSLSPRTRPGRYIIRHSHRRNFAGIKKSTASGRFATA